MAKCRKEIDDWHNLIAGGHGGGGGHSIYYDVVNCIQDGLTPDGCMDMIDDYMNTLA